VRIAPETGLPANYHVPSDRPDAIDYRQLVDAIRFVERFIREISSREVKPKAGFGMRFASRGKKYREGSIRPGRIRPSKEAKQGSAQDAQNLGKSS
jgi:hypothetical protein